MLLGSVNINSTRFLLRSLPMLLIIGYLNVWLSPIALLFFTIAEAMVLSDAYHFVVCVQFSRLSCKNNCLTPKNKQQQKQLEKYLNINSKHAHHICITHCKNMSGRISVSVRVKFSPKCHTRLHFTGVHSLTLYFSCLVSALLFLSRVLLTFTRIPDSSFFFSLDWLWP